MPLEEAAIKARTRTPWRSTSTLARLSPACLEGADAGIVARAPTAVRDGLGRMDIFRARYLDNLKLALAVYPTARVRWTRRGWSSTRRSRRRAEGQVLSPLRPTVLQKSTVPPICFLQPKNRAAAKIRPSADSFKSPRLRSPGDAAHGGRSFKPMPRIQRIHPAGAAVDAGRSDGDATASVEA